MVKLFAILGCAFALIAVAMGAFGAHGLKSAKLDSPLGVDYLIGVWETGAKYQMYHALALFVVAWTLSQLDGSRWAVAAGVAFVAGMVIFSGSLYTLVLTEVKTWGAITPIGGVALMVGWALLAAAWVGAKSEKQKNRKAENSEGRGE